MRSAPLQQEFQHFKVTHYSLQLDTEGCLQFIDLTEQIHDAVRQSAVCDGLVTIQTLHTTTGILVNENEPCLIRDLTDLLEQLAPCHRKYRHNDFTIRTHNLLPGEDQNGHSHCKATLLRTSETLSLAEGKLQLGNWQRIFFVELDKAKQRRVSVTVLGSAWHGAINAPRMQASDRHRR